MVWLPVPCHDLENTLGENRRINFEFSVTADVILNSGEAFVKAIADTYRKEFGNVKIAFDVI